MDEDGFAWRDSVIAIVGLGLMGGSFALALREHRACARILAVERNAATRADALARGSVDEASDDLALVARADVIVLATPVRVIVELVPRVGALTRPGAVVFDLGSTKRAIVNAMENLPTHIHAIGAHPMCGKETSGFDAADANLFRDAPFVLTPLARTTQETVTRLASLATRLGSRPLVLDAARHDKIVAAISHLPFAVASNLMMTASEFAQNDDALFALAASGFRDTSRLAASNTTMMLDILLTNRDHVAACLRDYSRNLNALADAIERGNDDTLRARLQSAAELRRGLFQIANSG
ncbi:MAG: prephenate dehydrogenase [Chloroflexi bacterium]|nr:prephenate dehydrogenase [Chloroflexota bacterium]